MESRQPKEPRGQRLQSLDLEILRALAAAEEPLQSRQLSVALGLVPENSTPRVRLAPKFPLRARGYAMHIQEEGYVLTHEGRRFLEAQGKE